jgi:hypothetical protein
MDKIQISVDVITGEITQTVTQFTDEELANSAKLLAEQTAKQQAEIAVKQSGLSKLTALGLTADEVKALVGVA